MTITIIRQSLFYIAGYLVLSVFITATAHGQELGNSIPSETTKADKVAMQQYDKRMRQAAKEAGVAVSRCKGQRTRKELKTHAQFAKCVNQAIGIAYERAGYLYPDLTESLNEKRLDIAQKIDQKQLTEAQGNTEFSKFSAQVSEEEITRNIARKASAATVPSEQ